MGNPELMNVNLTKMLFAEWIFIILSKSKLMNVLQKLRPKIDICDFQAANLYST